MFNRLLVQLIVLITVAILIGLCLTHLGIGLIIGIPLGIAIQFGLYYSFTTALNAYVELKNKKLENERIKEFSLQGLEVTCPCALKKTEFVPVVLNTDNKYNCSHCQKNVSVYIVPETALVTEPLTLPQVPSMISTAE
jgi:hypothetical protein